MKPKRGAESLLTRRNWAAMLAAATVAAPLIAQVPSTPPAASPAITSPTDDVRKTSEQLSQIEVPMSLEPAFTFHA